MEILALARLAASRARTTHMFDRHGEALALIAGSKGTGRKG